MVDVDAGAVAVAQEVSGSLGRSFSPCASSGATTWYFPSGSTLVNSDTEISLLNPYPSDSIVDLSFSTDQGVETPVDFEGLDVPARGLITVDLRNHMRRRLRIATTVSVRTGSLVAWETSWTLPPAKGAVILGTPQAQNPLADPSAPVAGLTVTLGAPSSGLRWVWADGLSGPGIDESYNIYNPGPQTAQLRLALDLEQGQAEPFELTLGGYQTVEVVSASEARIPAGVAHAATLLSLNGVPVVAARNVAAVGEGSAARPGPLSQSGLGQILGLRVPGRQWVIPATASGHGPEAQVTLFNPTGVSARVTVDAMVGGHETPVGGAGGYAIAPSSRLAIPLPAGVAYGNPLLIGATVAVYAEYDVYGSSTAGMSLSPGVLLQG
jgi:hypothetical protein